MSQLKVRSLSGITGEISVPGDKSISHRAAILAGISNGVCRVRNFLPSGDCLDTLKAMESLGVECEVVAESEFGPVDLLIHGQGRGLRPSLGPIDCGNSGTGMRLLAGLLAAQPFRTTLTGDASLSGRPMGRIIQPLTRMGGKIETRGERPGCAPLVIDGQPLRPIKYEMPVASAQVKSAILLAGLYANGRTTVVQPAETRDHTERMMAQFGVRTVREGNEVSIYGDQQPEAVDVDIPGDISSAAFWIVATSAMQGARLLVTDVGLNPTRSAILGVLLRMGASIKDVVRSGQGQGEPSGNIEVRGNILRGTVIRKEEVANLIDEIPILAVAGALAQGRMVIRNASELRVKETDRITTVVENLRAMGVEVEEFEDGMEITGGRRLKGAHLDCFGDHRIAMAFVVAGMFATGETVIRNTECIATSYPGFERDLLRMRERRRN